MTFFNIVPKRLKDTHTGLNLHVIQDDGFDVEPLIDINVTDLNKNNTDNTLYKQFHINGDGGILFKIEIIIKHDETWNNKKVVTWLHEWYSTMTEIYVDTDAIDIPVGNYIITKNPKRKQTFEKTTEWSLEFTTYNPLTIIKYKNDNVNIKQALKNFNKAKKKAEKQAKNTKLNSKLSKCKVGNLKYKQTNKCCNYLNRKLVLKGYLSTNNWKEMQSKKKNKTFTKYTTTALKKFQKEYNKKHKSKKIKVNGKMDSATLKALINT